MSSSEKQDVVGAGDHLVYVVIRERDLVTGETTVVRHQVPPPPDVEAKKRQLATVVSQLHPEARFMSYEDHAALFITDRVMVTAFYEDPKSIAAALASQADGRQASLLDAA